MMNSVDDTAKSDRHNGLHTRLVSGFSFEMIFLKESQDFVKSGQNMAGIFLEKIL